MKVGFLTNLFHFQVTRSSRFFLELLQEQFGDVKVIPHEYAWLSLPDKSLDLLVVWQKLYSPEELSAFGVPRVVIVPMSDDAPSDVQFWAQYRDCRILCFSSTFYDAVKSSGPEAFPVRYYPPLPNVTQEFDRGGIRAFFWPRLPEISWQTVRALLSDVDVESFHLHWTERVVRHKIVPPEPDDFEKYRIRVSHWFEDPTDYRRELSSSNVFFASRDHEGIGMSFLEAMTYGLCVVSPWRPTASEYIRNGENGLLYDLDNPKQLDFGDVDKLGRAARESVVHGRSEWQKSLPLIKDFVSTGPVRPQSSRHIGLVIGGRTKDLGRKTYRQLLTITGLRLFIRWMRRTLRKRAVVGSLLPK